MPPIPYRSDHWGYPVGCISRIWRLTPRNGYGLAGEWSALMGTFVTVRDFTLYRNFQRVLAQARRSSLFTVEWGSSTQWSFLPGMTQRCPGSRNCRSFSVFLWITKSWRFSEPSTFWLTSQSLPPSCKSIGTAHLGSFFLPQNLADTSGSRILQSTSPAYHSKFRQNVLKGLSELSLIELQPSKLIQLFTQIWPKSSDNCHPYPQFQTSHFEVDAELDNFLKGKCRAAVKDKPLEARALREEDTEWAMSSHIWLLSLRK